MSTAAPKSMILTCMRQRWVMSLQMVTHGSGLLVQEHAT
jgi:hypothetical protein